MKTFATELSNVIYVLTSWWNDILANLSSQIIAKDLKSDLISISIAEDKNMQMDTNERILKMTTVLIH